ncbi:hypothetical protein MKX03_002497, partial [Papaver bracteatum]
YSIDSGNSKKDRSTKVSVTKKRKLQDIVCTEDGLKKPRIDKETLGKKYLEASHQQITTLSFASDT